MSGDFVELELRGDLTELPGLFAMVTDFAGRQGLNADLRRLAQLVLDEAVSNVIRYAYGGQTGQSLKVRLAVSGGEIVIQVEDGGAPFNPLKHPMPDLTGSLQDRPIGGLGIHLVRTLTDSVQYRRHDGHNILTMRKRVAPAAHGKASRAMQIRQITSGGATVIALSGEVNALTALELEADVRRTLTSGTKFIVFDLGKLEFASSAGLRVFLLAIKEAAAAGGKVRFAALTPTVHKIFDVAGLSLRVELFPTLEAALINFPGRAARG
jgi:anti-anti-sigma factor